MNKSLLFTAGIVGASVLIYKLNNSMAYCLPLTIERPRIMLLGDSLTGTASYCATVRKVIQASYPGAEVYCQSYPGKGIAYIRKEGLANAAVRRPDVVVLLAGVNDLAAQKSVIYVTDQLDQTYRAFEAKNIPVVAVMLTPWSTHVKGQHLHKETAKVNAYIYKHPLPCTVVDSTGLRGQGRDGLHLTLIGGQNLAKIVIKRTIGVI